MFSTIFTYTDKFNFEIRYNKQFTTIQIKSNYYQNIIIS